MEHEPLEERPDATTDTVDETDVDTREHADTTPDAAGAPVAADQSETSVATDEEAPEAAESSTDLAAEALLLDETAGELADDAIAAEVMAGELAADAMTAASVADELARAAEQAQAAGDDERAAELATEAEEAAEASDELAAEAVVAEASAEELDTDAVVAETAAAEAADEALDLAALEDAAEAAADAEEVSVPDETQPAPSGSGNGEVKVVAAAEDAVEEKAEEEDAGAASRLRGPGDWYVVHTYSGYENKVKANLCQRIASMQMEDKIFEVVIPMEDVMEIKGGKKQVVQRKVFPGYLLVRMIYDNDSWYVVRNTPGVTGFVSSGTGTKPTPLSTREVQKILAVKEETQKKPEYRLEWEEGDVVRIVSGPFADFTGTISEINVEQSKLRVMVNIFDRETPVELAFDQVAKA